jgi:hypothetical protein
MESSIRVIFTSFIAFTFAVPPGFAADLARDMSSAVKFQKIYSRSANVKQLLENVDGQIPAADFKFIKDKIKDMKSGPLPKMEIRGDQMIFIDQARVITLKVVSVREMKFDLNGHAIDLRKVTDPDARWKLFAAALPHSRENALWNLWFPKADAQVVQLISGIGLAVLYIGGLYFSNDSTCKDIGLANDNCHKVKRKIELFYRKMKRAAEAQAAAKQADDDEIAQAKKNHKKKKKKKKKDDDEDDPDEELAAYLKFKDTIKKSGGQCSDIQSANDDLDDTTSDMVSEVSRSMQVTQSWIAQCSKDSRDRVEKCLGEVTDHAKKLCFHLTLNALEIIKNENKRTETAVSIDPMNDSAPASK